MPEFPKYRSLVFAALLLGCAGTLRAQLTAISGLYTTGVNNSGVKLGNDVADSHYVVTAKPAGAPANNLGNSRTVTTLPGPWLANPSNARWITTPGTASSGGGTGGGNANRVAGTFDYTLSFTMPVGAQMWNVSITGAAAADDTATIYVNGILVSGQSIAGYGAASSFTLDSSNSTFIGGTNTITFRVNNSSAGFTGLMVTSLGGNVMVPEVGSFLPLVGAFGAYGYIALRRRRFKGQGLPSATPPREG